MMRWLVALLLVANILFGALVGFGGSSRNPDAQLLDLQMNAQQVRVVGGGQDQPAPKGKPAVPGAACLAWGPFAEADAARARELLSALVPAEAVTSREVVGAPSWWVFMPPQKSRAEAQRKMAELKTLGITGYSLVETENEWQNAVDLGVFPSEARAREYLATLQQAGVRSAQVGERRGRAGVEWLVREPGEAVMARVLEIKQANFPESALGAIECPAGPAR
ncbi:MAG: SPOR domain-containing protein [Burkholderiales bacterium]|nr:SPOR domain-containing protein [Burkholderiales bacterium]